MNVSLFYKIKNEMIQRIQSIYLALAAFAAIIFLVPFQNLPLARFYGETVTLHFHSLYIENLIPGEASPFHAYFTWPLVTAIILVAILALISIFLYKNRSMQMMWIKINIFVSMAVLGGFFFGYMPLLEKKLGTEAIYSFTSFLPALILLFLVLAFRGVKNDDKLVKSMDRIR